MNNYNVRITEIEIYNFKNVEFGQINLDNKKYSSSVLGLYGQNGSGKTALIDAIALLKNALCGLQIPKQFADYINISASYSEFKFKFSVSQDKKFNEIIYSFKLRKETRKIQNIDKPSAEISMPVIFDEIFSVSISDNDVAHKMQEIINTSSEYQTFGPNSKFKQLIPDDVNINDIIVIKKITALQSRSFLFSKELLDIFRNKINVYSYIIEAIVDFGNNYLFVIDTKNNALISLDALPVAFKIKDGNKNLQGNIAISSERSIIAIEIFNILQNLIKNMNIVLKELIPGLTVELKNMGPVLWPDGHKGIYVQLLSIRNGKSIPIKYESEGIKKIISILQLLIVVYNNPSITVAVDELDAGIFEYLLGEILKIISEHGKGQLIFTSHNLRPLETIDKCFIAFTTVNPLNRYVRMKNVNKNNNLRDFYYRDIMLGGQSEKLYDETNNHEISFAFKEAMNSGK